MEIPEPTNTSYSAEQLETPISEIDVGFDVLDQTQHEKDGYNPSKETINKYLSNVINNYSDIVGFTLTLKKKYHNDDDKYMHRLIENKILRSSIWKDKCYIIFPEYTRKGNLHYHGIMWNQYEIEVMRCLKWWRRIFGFAKPELKINSKYNWIKYITKDYMKTGLWTIYNIKHPKEIAGGCTK